MRSKFTEEEKQFIKDNVKGNSSFQLTNLVNQKFNKNITVKQIQQHKKTYKLKSGVNTKFQKNQKAHNHKQVGYEFVSTDGYTYVKIAEPNIWKHKQVHIYEIMYGSIPTDHSVIFADGNKQNFEPSNLILVKNKDKLVMKNKHLIFKDKELTKTGLLIAQIINKASEVRKKNERKN